MLALVTALVALPGAAFAAGGEASRRARDERRGNHASLQRGASNFVNYCLGCHSAKYVRYNRVAADLGLTEQQMIDNLMFTGDSPHETHAQRHQCRRRKALVRRGAAGPVADRAQHAARTTSTRS